MHNKKLNEIQTKLEKIGLNIFLIQSIDNFANEIEINDLDFKTIILIGNGGKKFWKNFHSPDPIDHRFDQFSLSVFEEIKSYFPNEKFEVLYPHLHLNIPLQKISRHGHFSYQSPLGIDISPKFGLWFAFRLAFITSLEFPIKNRSKSLNPCEKCLDKPCLKYAFDFEMARASCPYKREMKYSKDQRKYHQKALKILV